MRTIRIIIGLCISAICLVVVFARLDFAAFWQQLAGLRLLPLAAFVAIQLVEMGIRALRWRGLVEAVAERPGFPATFRAYAAGYLFNSTLPARLGEYARAAMLARHGSFRASLLLGTVVVERLQDLAILSVIVVGSAALLAPPVWIYRAAGMGMGVFLTGSLGLLLIGRLGRERLLRLEVFENFRRGFDSIRDLRATVQSLSVAAAAWIADAVALATVLFAFDIDIGIPGTLLVMAIVSLGMAIPAGPAGVGTQQVAFIAALSLFGIPEPHALAVSVVVQGLTVSLFASTGAISLSLEELSRDAVLAEAREMERERADRDATPVSE
jgi:uncharacterized membrane protein YbhN (UPF0104 family)